MSFLCFLSDPLELIFKLAFSSGDTLDMDKGHMSLIPYSAVEQLVLRGEVELI